MLSAPSFPHFVFDFHCYILIAIIAIAIAIVVNFIGTDRATRPPDTLNSIN